MALVTVSTLPTLSDRGLAVVTAVAVVTVLTEYVCDGGDCGCH